MSWGFRARFAPVHSKTPLPLTGTSVSSDGRFWADGRFSGFWKPPSGDSGAGGKAASGPVGWMPIFSSGLQGTGTCRKESSRPIHACPDARCSRSFSGKPAGWEKSRFRFRESLIRRGIRKVLLFPPVIRLSGVSRFRTAPVGPSDEEDWRSFFCSRRILLSDSGLSGRFCLCRPG